MSDPDIVPKTLSGTDVLTIGAGAALLVSGTAISWNGPSTGAVIDNSGTIASTASSGRAINASGSASGGRTLTLFNRAGAAIQSEGDAFRINLDFSVGIVTIHNAGTIVSSVGGQALDFDSVASTTAGQIVIDNEATGIIQANSADAIRPGQNATINNAGLIRANGPVGESHDAVDFQARGGIVNNLAGGEISGQRHGVTADGHVVVDNQAGATIIGRNGSGVNSDGTAKVINHGTIIGTTDGSLIGDGDGIDIDVHGEVDNWGLIQAIGNGDPANINDEGHQNFSEGVVIDGGYVHNHDTGIIRSTSAGIMATNVAVTNEGLVEADWNGVLLSYSQLGNLAGGEIRGLLGTGVTAFIGASIDNAGLISGVFTGITIFADAAIVNDGTILAAIGIRGLDESSVSVSNGGTIGGDSHAILFGGGADTLIIRAGGQFIGAVEGGGGSDMLRLEDGAVLDAVSGFEILEVTGEAIMAADNRFVEVEIGAGGNLILAEGVVLVASDYVEIDGGTLTVTDDLDAALSPEIGGSGTIVKMGSGTLALDGDNHDFAGTLEIRAGRVVVDNEADLGTAIVDLGLGDGALSVASGVAFANRIAGFGVGDAIDLGNIDFAGASAVRIGSDVHIEDGAGHSLDLALTLSGVFRFTLGDDGTGHLRLGAAVNAAPTGADFTETIDEDATYVLDAARFGFDDADGDAFYGVRIVAAPAGGRLCFDGVEVTGFPTGTYTEADVLAGRLTFVPSPNLNGIGAASLAFRLLDEAGNAAGPGGGGAANILTFDITPIDDPDIAKDDAFGTNETIGFSGSLLADNGSGSDSGDGPLLVSEVNGSAANVGTQITLASGARLIVDANGTFAYDPNGAFDPTPDVASGAVNTPAVDSFTYTLAGGGTATVTVTIAGVDSDDILFGTANGDFLFGGFGEDMLSGLAGNDYLDGGDGADMLVGGLGDDVYVVDDQGDLVIDGAGAGLDRVYALANYALTAGQEIEILAAGGASPAAPLRLTGNDLANNIWGNEGDNRLEAGAGNDSLFGFAGNDYLHGGTGADFLVGGAGDDTYVVDDVGDVVVDVSGEGQDRVYALASYTLTAGQEIEILAGGGPNAMASMTLTGNEFANNIWDNGAGNSLFGGGGNDALFGFAGDDVLDGGEGDDFLVGGEGGDTLNGSAGADLLLGQAGADNFRFAGALGATNVDRILDFSAADDTIQLDDSTFTGLALGALAPGAFVIGAAAGDADDRIIYDQITGTLYFDADGSGAGARIAFAFLDGAPALSASDFILI